MTYTEFNQCVLKHYLSKARSDFFSLSMDRTELKSIIPPEEIKHFVCLKDDWISLLDKKNGIPQYFGLIALQCVAGSMMENDGKDSERVYQIRLQQVLHLPDKNIQDLFKGKNPNYSTQEKIWFAAKDYLYNEHGLSLDIPACKQNKGRYIQFPLSQVFFTTEELKHFTIFFSETFMVNENIPFYYFKNKLEEWYPNRVSSRINNLFSNDKKKESSKSYLFNHYQSWDGSIYKKGLKQKLKNHKNNLTDSESSRLLLLINEEVPQFIINDQSIDPDEIFALNYFYFHKGIMLFNPYLNYDDAYEDCRLLQTGAKTIYLLLDRGHRPKEYNYLEQHNDAKTRITPQITLYQLNTHEHQHHYLLKRFFYQINPVVLHGGLRLQHNKYLQGYGPVINYDKEWKLIVDHRPVTYDPLTSPPGNYYIRTNDYKDLSFSIVESSPITQIPQVNKGWDLSKLAISDIPMLEGYYCYPILSNNKHPIRNWINALIGKNKSNNNLHERSSNHAANKTC